MTIHQSFNLTLLSGMSQELVFYQDRIIVPKSLRCKVLADLHEGHMGITKTMQFAKQSVFWPSLANSIETLVSQCDLCNKFHKSNTREEIIQHEIPLRAYEKVGCDVVDGQPNVMDAVLNA
jgi:hypothetical protein